MKKNKLFSALMSIALIVLSGCATQEGIIYKNDEHDPYNRAEVVLTKSERPYHPIIKVNNHTCDIEKNPTGLMIVELLLPERGLVSEEGHVYQVNEAGSAHINVDGKIHNIDVLRFKAEQMVTGQPYRPYIGAPYTTETKIIFHIKLEKSLLEEISKARNALISIPYDKKNRREVIKRALSLKAKKLLGEFVEKAFAFKTKEGTQS